MCNSAILLHNLKVWGVGWTKHHCSGVRLRSDCLLDFWKLQRPPVETIHPFSWAKIIIQEVFGDLRLLVREKKKKKKVKSNSCCATFSINHSITSCLTETPNLHSSTATLSPSSWSKQTEKICQARCNNTVCHTRATHVDNILFIFKIMPTDKASIKWFHWGILEYQQLWVMELRVKVSLHYSSRQEQSEGTDCLPSPFINTTGLNSS